MQAGWRKHAANTGQAWGKSGLHPGRWLGDGAAMKMPRRLQHPPFAVLALTLLISLPEIVLTLADQGAIGSARWRPLAYQFGAFWAGLLYDWKANYAGQPQVMFLSYAFLHAGPAHLAGNLVALWGLGPVVVDRMGGRRFLWLCLICAIGGGAGFGLLASSPAPMVGASGLLFGLAGAWAAWDTADRWRGGRALWPTLLGITGLVTLNALFWLAANGLLAWETHLGGFLAGAAATLFRPFSGGPPAGQTAKPQTG